MKFSGRFDSQSLTELKREELKGWFRGALGNQSVVWPLGAEKLVVYVEGKPLFVTKGEWMVSGEYIYVGKPTEGLAGNYLGEADRLGVIMVLMEAVGMLEDEELKGLVTQRLGRLIAGIYEQVVGGLVKAEVKVERLAFKLTGEIAAQMTLGSWDISEAGELTEGATRLLTSGWFGPTGEPQEVDNGWTQVEVEARKELKEA